MIKPQILKFKSRTFILLAAIFLTALAIRIIYIYQIQINPLTEQPFFSKDYDNYIFNKNAIGIAKGDWLLKEKGALTGIAPLYCYFLGIIYKLFSFSHLAARIIQAFLGAGLCILLYFIAKETFGKGVGIIAAIIASGYGPFIFHTEILLRGTLVTFLNMVLLYLLIRLSKKPMAILGLFAGMVYELSFLTRENILLPFILIWLWVTLRKIPLKKFLKVNMAFIIGTFLVFAPFLIRNYLVLNKFAVTQANAYGFWVGNTYDSPGVGLEWKTSYYEMVEKTGNNLGKIALYFLEEIKKRPKAYLNLYLRKFTMFLNGYEVPGNLHYHLFREFPTILRFPWFSFTFISPFGLAGMFLALFSRKRISILYVFTLALSLIVILFHIQDRYRLPVVPLFIIFAGYSLYWCFQQLKEKRYKKLIFLGIAFIPLFLLAKPDPSYRGYFKKPDFIQDNSYGNLANSYIRKFRQLRLTKKELPDERFMNDAVKYLKKMVDLYPFNKDTAVYSFYLGIVYFETGQKERAKKEWERTLRFDADFEPAKTNLALLTYELGEASEEAISAFKNILDENPTDPGARQNLANIYLGLGRVEEAIIECKKAISYYPEMIELYALLKKAYDMKGLSKEEIRKRLKQKAPSELVIGEAEKLSSSYQLGMEYIMAKKYDRAIAQFQKVLEESPDSIKALINLGVAYRAAGRPNEAISSYEHVLKLAPEAIPARYNLAMVLLSEDRFKEAIPHLESIVSIFPEYLLSQFHLAGAYGKTGLKDKALKEYQKFISWAKDNPDRQRVVEQAKDKVAILQSELEKATRPQMEDLLIKRGYE